MKPEQKPALTPEKREMAQMLNVLFNEAEQRMQHRILQVLHDEKEFTRTNVWVEINKAYEKGYAAGRNSAFAEIAAAKAHSVPKVDPHPTLDLFSHVDTTNENGERLTTGLKRKSPEPHDVFHHSDEFWLNVCREYQQLKHRNPNLTQADFVRIKANPRIKIKTFNAKLLQLTTTGTFAHKPRIRRK